MVGSIVFVHGTGVRLRGYERSVSTMKTALAQAGFTQSLVECAWGDPLGITFDGLSLPDSPTPAEVAQQELDYARWAWLFDDPLAELEQLSIRATANRTPPPPPGQEPVWRVELAKILAYSPSKELVLLLQRGFLEADWDKAWTAIAQCAVTSLAFERSGEAGELADCAHALARALVAQLHVLAITAGRPGPSAQLREALAERIAFDWGAQVFGLGSFLGRMFLRATTAVLRRRRSDLNETIAGPIGDVLLYQGRGAAIREFIRGKIQGATAPITVVAHSLGGIACVDLLALPDAPVVETLITVGSQSPYFYEIGALQSVNAPQTLPAKFPRWLNVFDRDDFLSFVGERVFPGRVRDFEVRSGQPFPDSHGAYFANQEVWVEARRFIEE